MIACSSCHEPYPEKEIVFRCPRCGGVYDFSSHPPFRRSHIEATLPGIWPYRRTFELPTDSPLISLGEGNTPLVWSESFGREIAFKLESQNPTGSFKDRGTAVLVSFLAGKGVHAAVEDSSGNAGASFAAYAARAGIKARVYVPAYASGPKRDQIKNYGAEVVPVPGPRSRATKEVLQAANQGAIYASHAYLPHGIPGFATIAYELYSDLEVPPGTVVMPVGHGSLLLGLARGFKALQAAGLVSHLPVLIGVQAKACAPLVQAFEEGAKEPVEVEEAETLAEGVRIREPYRGGEVLKAIRETGGKMVALPESRIKQSHERLGASGIYVEMTSALVWGGLEEVVGEVPEPIVALITGHGLKGG